MALVRIEADEWFPHFYIEEEIPLHNYASERNIEIPDEVIDRAKKVQAEWEVVQKELATYHPDFKEIS